VTLIQLVRPPQLLNVLLFELKHALTASVANLEGNEDGDVEVDAHGRWRPICAHPRYLEATAHEIKGKESLLQLLKGEFSAEK
jgi:hypothetical protein